MKLSKLLTFLLILCSSCNLFAENIRITLLGTGTPRPDINRFGPAVLVEVQGERLLFDTGRGVTLRLHQLNIPLGSINKVFFTHLHSDHVVGFADLWLTSWIWQRKIPLQVWGPVGTQSMMESLKNAYQSDIHIRRDLSEKLPAAGVKLDVSEITQGLVYQKGKLRVTAFKVDHAPVKDAFGYRIDFEDKAIVISGDTTYSDNLIEYSQGVDLLLHEIVLAPAKAIHENLRLQSIIKYHTNPEQLVQVLEKSEPKLAILTHLLLLGGVDEEQLRKRIKKNYKGILIIGEDLMSFEIGETIRRIDGNSL